MRLTLPCLFVAGLLLAGCSSAGSNLLGGPGGLNGNGVIAQGAGNFGPSRAAAPMAGVASNAGSDAATPAASPSPAHS